MKKIFYYVMALALGCSQMSCSDLLDQKPQGVLTEDDLTGGTYETQIFNMYALLRGYHIVSGNTALAIHGMRSEDAEKGSTLSDGSATGKMFDDFEYAASNGMVKSYWNANYTLIHKANDVLEEMKSNPSLTGGDLVNKGEALLMRAFCYFNLVRAFGEVPLIDFKVGSVADANIPKSSVDQIYTLIDEDLTNAVTASAPSLVIQCPTVLLPSPLYILLFPHDLLRSDTTHVPQDVLPPAPTDGFPSFLGIFP